MTVLELIEAAKNRVVTDEMIEQFAAHHNALEEQYREEAKRKEITLEWLNKPFASL